MYKYHEADPSVIHLAEDLIKKYSTDLEDANIAIVFREETDYKRKWPTFYGKTQLVPSQFSPWMEFDFLLILNEEEWIDLNDDQRTAVLDHLLTYCGRNPSGAWALNKPDVIEFSSVIKRNGFWSRELDRADLAHQVYQQQRLPGAGDAQITVSAGGRVATITGAGLDRLNESLAKGG